MYTLEKRNIYNLQTPLYTYHSQDDFTTQVYISDSETFIYHLWRGFLYMELSDTSPCPYPHLAPISSFILRPPDTIMFMP